VARKHESVFLAKIIDKIDPLNLDMIDFDELKKAVSFEAYLSDEIRSQIEASFDLRMFEGDKIKFYIDLINSAKEKTLIKNGLEKLKLQLSEYLRTRVILQPKRVNLDEI
jgi:hypothetical protein